MKTFGDEEKLLRAQQGDADAFAELFEALRPAVHSIAWRQVGPDYADDVVMETYLKAWKALPRFNRRAKLKTWLYRITYNCAMDFLRSRQRSKEVHLVEHDQDSRTIADFPDDRQASPAEAFAAGEMRALVAAAVARLAEPHRTTLLLRYADALSYAEVAAATGVSIGTVMSRLFHGRRKLKKEFFLLADEKGPAS